MESQTQREPRGKPWPGITFNSAAQKKGAQRALVQGASPNQSGHDFHWTSEHVEIWMPRSKQMEQGLCQREGVSQGDLLEHCFWK